MRTSTVLRIYKILMATMLLLTGTFVVTGQQFTKGNIPVVNYMLGAGFAAGALSSYAAAWFDRRYIYDAAFFFANTILSAWTFTSAVYASFGLASWGRVVVFLYVLVQNTIILPYLLNARAAEDALARSQDVIGNIQQRREERNQL